jgi:hypothetical protein
VACAILNPIAPCSCITHWTHLFDCLGIGARVLRSIRCDSTVPQ